MMDVAVSGSFRGTKARFMAQHKLQRCPLAPSLQNHIKERLDLDMPLKPHTHLFNVLIQLLIWIDLPHQVLQLLFTENLRSKQMHPFFIDTSCLEPKLTTEPPQTN